MEDRQQFMESDSQDSIVQEEVQPRCHVSVLKHIPAARKILDGQNKAYELYSPRCLFSEELPRTNKHIMPKIDLSARLIENRLLSIQDAAFQYGKLKDKLKDIHSKQQKQCLSTLWDIYSDKDVYYHRFQPCPKKQNFANLFLNISGINLEHKLKINNFPQIKAKAQDQIAKNSGPLIFDSNFQSGNLLYVYRNNDERNAIETYDLVLQNDVNTRGHNQWFYFKITNTKKNQKIKLNIVNLVKKQSLFSYGLKPMTFSEKNSKNGVSWVRNGTKVYYEENSIKRESKNEFFNTLSFEYEFREAYDTVYFAPSYPYTYSQLLYFMDTILQDKRYTNFLTIKKLCQSAGKNAINIISITTGKQTTVQKQVIWILGRQHPVETTSSYMVEGIVLYLLNLMMKQSQRENSMFNNYVFKIIPMINPDGVIHGNSRAELTGIDPNRIWKKPSKRVTPSIYYIKKQILKTKEQTVLILDLHSHSKKLGCFFYGNYRQTDVKAFRLLPSSVCQNDIRFCYKNCRFRGGNDNSARKSLFADINIANIFTVECSLLGYIKDNRITEYKIADYHEMGVKIMDTFFGLQEKKHSIETYPHQRVDCCDAQSARSDSQVSDQQYEQVYNFGKIKKKLKQTKKSKPRSNTFVYTHKHQLSDVNTAKRIQNSSVKIIQEKKTDLSNIIQEKKIMMSKNQLNKEEKRQFSIKLRSNNRNLIKNIKTLVPTKKFNTSIREDIDDTEMKSYGQKSVQVQELQVSNKDLQTIGKIKLEKKLIIVGNSLEDQKLFVNRNEVGIQMNNVYKENLCGEDSKQKRISSNKLNVKLHKRPFDDNIQLRLQRSTKMERRGLNVFRN